MVNCKLFVIVINTFITCPKHTKSSIVYSQTQQVKRLCSLKNDFNYRKLNMKEWFIKKDYPEAVLPKEGSLF